MTGWSHGGSAHEREDECEKTSKAAATDNAPAVRLDDLSKETNELTAIFVTVVRNLKRKR